VQRKLFAELLFCLYRKEHTVKFKMQLLAFLILLLATFNPQSSASAAVYRFKDATAWFYSTDASGCIRTVVGIEAGADFLYSLSLFQYDDCQEQIIIEAYGRKALSNSEIRHMGILDSASLQTTVQVTDFDRTVTLDLWVDVTWTGVGEISEYHEHRNYWPSPSCHVNSHLWEAYRHATVSGTVSDGTTNYTPEPTTGADLYSARRVDASQSCD
jgi:hypothetical protein